MIQTQPQPKIMNEFCKKFLKYIAPISQFTAIMIVGSLIIISTSWATNYFKKPDQIEKIVTVTQGVPITPPTCIGGYNEFQKLLTSKQVVELIANTPMHAVNNQLVNSKTVSVNRAGTGEIACGYLYVLAHKDGKALEDNYDSVFISPQGFGGHILSEKGNFTIPNSTSTKTEFLLPLNAISYLPNLPFNPKAQNFEIANWVNLLNVSNQLHFLVGLSTLHAQGEIDNVTIAYKCWNPDTGIETHDCQLGQ